MTRTGLHLTDPTFWNWSCPMCVIAHNTRDVFTIGPGNIRPIRGQICPPSTSRRLLSSSLPLSSHPPLLASVSSVSAAAAFPPRSQSSVSPCTHPLYPLACEQCGVQHDGQLEHRYIYEDQDISITLRDANGDPLDDPCDLPCMSLSSASKHTLSRSTILSLPHPLLCPYCSRPFRMEEITRSKESLHLQLDALKAVMEFLRVGALIHIYIYINIHTQTPTFSLTYLQSLTHSPTHTHIDSLTRTHSHTHTHSHSHTHTHTLSLSLSLRRLPPDTTDHSQTHKLTHSLTHIHTYIHTYTHTYTHIYTYTHTTHTTRAPVLPPYLFRTFDL